VLCFLLHLAVGYFLQFRILSRLPPYCSLSFPPDPFFDVWFAWAFNSTLAETFCSLIRIEDIALGFLLVFRIFPYVYGRNRRLSFLRPFLSIAVGASPFQPFFHSRRFFPLCGEAALFSPPSRFPPYSFTERGVLGAFSSRTNFFIHARRFPAIEQLKSFLRQGRRRPGMSRRIFGAFFAHPPIPVKLPFF